MTPAATKRAKAKPRTRNPEATRLRVLQAAKVEFAKLGLSGARVDAIAKRSKANKQMIYHYFGSKQALYLCVLEEAYRDIRAAEAELELDHLDPVEALKRLVTFTWDYYLANPEFLALVNTENLHQAAHLKRSKVIPEIHKPFRARLAGILERGAQAGVFRPDVDADQLNLTIAAIGYYYLTNRHTNSIIYRADLAAPKALQKRLKFNLDSVLRIVQSQPESPVERTK
ncbi:MAG: TetR family transcriptional regulator [Paludibaculum sp.]